MARILYRVFWLVLVGFAALYVSMGFVYRPGGLLVDSRYSFVLGGFFVGAALLMLSRFEGVRIAGTWLGIFLFLQMLIPPDLGLVNSHIQRAPNLVRYLEPHGYHDISGVQMFMTDGQGFRTDPRVDYGRKTRLRIVALGGSTTEEYSLDDRATWTHLLQEGLRAQHVDVEVINAGMSGTRTEHHVRSLQHLLRFEPDIAIFLIGFNDWLEGIRRHNYPQLVGERLWPTNMLLIKSIRRMRQLFYPRGKSAPILPRLADGSLPDVPAQYRTVVKRSQAQGPRMAYPRGLPPDVSEKFKRDMVGVLQTCREGKVRCLLMTQPSAFQDDADPAYIEAISAFESVPQPGVIAYAQRHNDYLRTFAKENGLALCDLAAQIRPSLDIFFDSHHFNTPGARRVAELVQECVLAMVSDPGRSAKGGAGS